MNDQIKGMWMVMDGRARTDPDRATVLEAVGVGYRDQVPRKRAKRDWKNHDAALCFAPVTGTQYGPVEYVEDV